MMTKNQSLVLVIFSVLFLLSLSSEMELMTREDSDYIPLSLGYWYSVNSTSTWFEYKLSSPSKTKLTFVFIEGKGAFPDFKMKTTSMNATLYEQFPYPKSSKHLTILSLFNVTFDWQSSVQNSIVFTNIFVFRFGIVNSYANTIRSYIFNGSHFVDLPNEIINSGASGFQWDGLSLENQSIIFGVFAYLFTPQFNSIIPVTGPSIFEFNIPNNNKSSSLSQSIGLSFPYQSCGYKHSPYFSLNDYTPSSKNEMPYGYIA
ncbi:hypothetical protein C9374_003168 [Naegleria lovaniensis]|uniref:Uncharacterized protein n=1 Tax=Naegleria lovaniensis TaxID=51637 RepID=A0AA88KLP5_NAELO|nr:uncharacterized protein C9374_003168 [Naegleria lovaniensis]KAG2386019.1 hypothetical protein C9374_003168 [Naegleria lovaniensis]